MPTKLLLIGLEPGQADAVTETFKRERNLTCEVVKEASLALEKLAQEVYLAIICNHDQLPEEGGSLEILARIKKQKIETPFILLVKEKEKEVGLIALQKGAYGYIVKTSNLLLELENSLERIWERYELIKEKEKLTTENMEKNVALYAATKKLEELVAKDELTGALNHRHFQERLNDELARTKRYHRPLSCLLIDIDRFRLINAEFGYEMGDYLLKELTNLLKDLLRQSDILARFGGEEFAILLPETPNKGAEHLAQRINQEVASHVFQKGDRIFKCTVSIGVTSYPEDDVRTANQFIEFSQRALTKAKALGGNQIQLYSQIMKEFIQKFPQLRIDQAKLVEVKNRIFDISENIKRTYIEATKAMVEALEAKDLSTKEHSKMVAKYALLIAKKLNLPQTDLEIIEHAGLLHDIGKICIDDAILFKPSKLTPEEYEVIKEHAILGYRILSPIIYLKEELPLILYHHEWFDGHGYPHGLKDHEIPLGARIISVVDAFVTMMDTSRLYRKTLSCKEAVQELIDCSGIQFDPKMVKVLIDVLLETGELKKEGFDQDKLDKVLKKFY